MKFKLPFFNREKAAAKNKEGVRPSELLPEWKTDPQQAKWADWSTENAIRYGYKVNSYVYACINVIATSAASIPWVVYQDKGKKTWEIVEGHPLELLIERPNPYTSRQELIRLIVMHLYLGGNSILTKVRANGTPSELWSLQPDAIRVIPDRIEYIKGYLYDRDGVKMQFDPADIIHQKFADPANPYWGMSPLQAGAKIVDTDTEAQAWNKIALENRAITDGVFTFDSPLTKQQWEDARIMIREQHQGMSNARTPWVLGAGAKWQSMSMSPAEMDFIESRKLTREEICSIFGVPPVMVGVYENATLANIETARKIFWQDTIIPLLEDLKATFNVRLTPDYGDDIMLDFDLSGVEALQENTKEKIANAKELWSMGVPFNLINQRLELGFDDIDGGDSGFISSSIMPTELVINPPSPPDGEASSLPPAAPKSAARIKTPESFKYGLNLQSDEHKEHYFKATEGRRAPWDLALTRKSAAIFAEEADAVAAAVAEAKPKTAEEIDYVIGKAIDRKKWESFFNSTWFSIVGEFGALSYDSLKKSAGPTESKESPFGITPWIRDYIISITASKVVGVTDFTKSIIAGIVLHATETDTGMDEVAKSIKGAYSEFSRYRSYRIARTEVAAASNYGNYEGAKATGLKLKKEWISSRDSRVRDSHERVDRSIVDMDEKFSNGLRFPADYESGRAAEVIHCRCTLAYISQ